MSKTAIVWTVVGGIAAVIGVVIGFVPIQDCGSAFVQGVGHGTSLDGYVADSFCDGYRAGPTWAAWILVITGLGTALLALTTGLSGHADVKPADKPRPDTVSRLRDLAVLHDSGALTETEYAAAKAKVIGQ